MYGSIFSLIGLGLLVYLFFSHHKLRSRVSDLEMRLRRQDPDAWPDSLKEPQRPVAPDTPLPYAATTYDPEMSAQPPAKEALHERTWVVQDEVPPPPASDVPKTFVFRQENLEKIGAWLAGNWFLAVAAISLALSAVFLVQYGIESGLITPVWRVIGAAALGVGLIVAGEYVRRRWGDQDPDNTAYLPSTFSGAGIVALFSAVLAARQLYDLIGPETAFVLLCLVSIVAVVLGWFYGPFLVFVGILGSVATPFLTGGETDNPEIFFYFFALIAWVGLAVDAIKHWAWVSVLTLIATYAVSWYIFDAGAGDMHFLAFALLTAFAAISFPERTLTPRHQGSMAVSLVLLTARKTQALPEFPSRVAAGTFLASSVAAFAVILNDAGSAEVWLAIFAIAVLFAAAVIWLWRAPALDDLALAPSLAFLAAIVLHASSGHLFRDFQSGLSRVPESSPPATVTVLAMLALGASFLAFLRSHQGKRHLMIWAAGSALFAPLVLILLEVFWSPAEVLGDGYWAGHAMIVAAAMVFFAERTIRIDSANRDRTAGFILAALTMISFALIIILSDAALTIALGFMTLVAAWLDRAMDVKRLSLFVRLGAIVTGVRLAVFPGPEWAYDAPVWEMTLAYLGTAGLIAAAWVIESAKHRPGTRVILESAIWVIVPVFASVALLRAMGSYDDSHFAVSLLGSIWLISAFGQLYRIKAGGKMKWVRITLASLAGLGALLFFFVGLVIMNPLNYFGDRVIGPLIIDSLAVAFLWPAAIFAVGALKLDHLYRWLRLGFAGTSALLSAWYVGLEIRRFWRGDDLSVPGVIQSENISYTIAMLVVAVALLFFAFGRRSKPLRRIAVIGIGLTIAKVFLIDMSGLVGLYRVVSFLGLGLSLSGLAWVDRQMARQWDRGSKSAE